MSRSGMRMSKFILEINEVYKNITRPVVMQITNDLINLTGFPKNSNIFFKGYSKQGVNKESVMGDKEAVDFSHKDRVLVSVENRYCDPSIYSGQPFKSNFRPIFYDKDHEIILSPINYEVESEITLNFISKDRVTIEKWRSDIRRKIGQSVKSYLHRIDYTYPIDDKFFCVLKHLYETKGINIENKISYVDWLANISLEKITGIVNQIGNGETAVVEQSQIGITGIFQEEVPEIEKLETGDLYQATMSYLIRYSQPTMLSLEYPIILNNTIISADYRTPCDYNLPLVLGNPDMLIWGLSLTREGKVSHYPCDSLRLPCFDEWYPKKFPMGTSGVYTALITVDKEQPDYVMDLIDLGEEYQLAPWFIDLMKLFNKDMLLLGMSPILVSLYRNENWINSDLLTIDDNLRLNTITPMQYFNQYHVRVALYTDLTLLTEKALTKLKENGELTNQLFKTLGPEYIDKIPPILSNGTIKNDQFWKHVSLLKETNPTYKNNIEIRRFTVGSCVITTRRRDDAVS